MLRILTHSANWGIIRRLGYDLLYLHELYRASFVVHCTEDAAYERLDNTLPQCFEWCYIGKPNTKRFVSLVAYRYIAICSTRNDCLPRVVCNGD